MEAGPFVFFLPPDPPSPNEPMKFTPSLLVSAALCSLATALAAPSASACTACGCEPKPASPTVASSHATAPMTAFERDRAAILAMAGEYKVTFQFQETVPIQAGYEPREPHRSGATEFVEVVEDTGEVIRLQHILVLADDDGGESRVVKHWRQDWTYEDTRVNRFLGNRRWEHVSLDEADVRGLWSQAVYQVDDSPRYESVGAWTHEGGRSAWTSEPTWRPLPRREHTKRSDYDVMVAVNRHTLTPGGWVHEQDNHKLVLNERGEAESVLVHESGLNVYDRVDGLDFSAGRAYWEDTQAYWQDVRGMWQDVLNQEGTATVAAEVNDKPVWSKLFGIAGDIRAGGAYETAHRERAHEVILAAVDRSAGR